MNLVIVESPTKVKTISKYLGKEYTVMSSKGHVRDLPKSGLGIDVDHNFKPEYTTMPGKESIVRDLKKAAKDANIIYLATDLDREGEAISWHIFELLKSSKKQKATSKEKSRQKKANLPTDEAGSERRFERVVFHEITKDAIHEAFEHPRTLNDDLIDAYQARRVLDRLVGYKLSPLLWEKIRYGLSAGRVQSVVVRLVVERERERQAFNAEPYFNFTAKLQADKDTALEALLWQYNNKQVEIKETIDLFVGDYTYSKTIFQDKKEVDGLEKDFSKQHYVVGDVNKKDVQRKATPPLTTARLQRQAVNRFGFTSKRAMSAAQKLYEAGIITYHRTDSIFLSDVFIKAARSYVSDKYGKKYIPDKPNHYANQSKSAQEAHEAIRPSDVTKDLDHKDIKKLAEDQKKIYGLIWRNAVASQMSPAELTQMRIDVHAHADKTKAQKEPETIWRTSGSKVNFPGWMRVMGKQQEDTLLPDMKVGDPLTLNEIIVSEHETQAPPRYTEASLIKDLEKYGIGRPSTYAPTISTVQSRKYVHKEDRYFVPDDTGMVVNDLLVKHFPDIVDLDFTAEMEDNLDKIAHGEEEWVPVIRDFYQPFIKVLDKKKKEIKKEDIVVLEETDEKCPECGKPLVVKLGKYGKFLSCSGFPDCEYAAPLAIDENGDAIEANESFGTCPDCGGNLIMKQGRFGKFIACNNYPKCKHTEPYLDKIGMACPDCKEGEVVKKQTKKHRTFYGCSRYPECEFSSWTDPRSKSKKNSDNNKEG